MVDRPAAFSLPSLRVTGLAARSLNWRVKRVVVYSRVDRRASLQVLDDVGIHPKPDTLSTSQSIPPGGKASIWPMQLHPQTFLAVWDEWR